MTKLPPLPGSWRALEATNCPAKWSCTPAGARGADALSVLQAHGAAVGSMHPLQSFSGVSVPSLEGRVFAIDGDSQAIRVARQMARALGGFSGPDRQREKKASVPCGRVDGRWSLCWPSKKAATQLLVSLGMRRSEAVRALLPLTRQVFR